MATIQNSRVKSINYKIQQNTGNVDLRNDILYMLYGPVPKIQELWVNIHDYIQDASSRRLSFCHQLGRPFLTVYS